MSKFTNPIQYFVFLPTWANGVGGGTGTGGMEGKIGLVVHPSDLFLQQLRFVPSKNSKCLWATGLWSGSRAAGSVPLKSLKVKGVWYRALALWGRRVGAGPILFPGAFALLGLRAVSSGLCPDSVTPDGTGSCPT